MHIITKIQNVSIRPRRPQSDFKDLEFHSRSKNPYTKPFRMSKFSFVGHTVPILGADGWLCDKPQLLPNLKV